MTGEIKMEKMADDQNKTLNSQTTVLFNQNYTYKVSVF